MTFIEELEKANAALDGYAKACEEAEKKFQAALKGEGNQSISTAYMVFLRATLDYSNAFEGYRNTFINGLMNDMNKMEGHV